MSKIKSREYITDSVPTAVWLSAIILTYNRSKSEFLFSPWLKQKDIQLLAGELCNKNIDNARISQWCNANHSNNTYNYLVSKGSLRRVTQLNEFNGVRELPEIIPSGVVEIDSIKTPIELIIEWYRDKYSTLDLRTSNGDIDLEENKTLSYSFNKEDDRVGIVSEEFVQRVQKCINDAWNILAHKIHGGLISINKEASLQLHYAHVLQQLLPLYIFRHSERVEIELETGVSINGCNRNIDVFVNVLEREETYKIAIEMKCYREYASSGGKRGAFDIFMKDVYVDLYLLEQYVSNSVSDTGVLLIMTDYRGLIYPRIKRGKCWRYDISHGANAKHGLYNTPIGGGEILFNLDGDYEFLWETLGGYYFTLIKR